MKREALSIDKVKMCQPIGAAYAALGIHECISHNHGSPGCCRFIRVTLYNSYKKNVRITSSNLKENSAIFGGNDNFKKSIKNILVNYNPKVIAVHTTCMSETIGEDIIGMKNEVEIPKDKYLVCCTTPSYSGSHITGYSNLLKDFIEQITEESNTMQNKAFIFIGFVNPSDMREIKRLVSAFDIKYTLFPDTSNVLDKEYDLEIYEYPEGGTNIDEIVEAGRCKVIYSLGSEGTYEAAKSLHNKSLAPINKLQVPIGINKTDEFIECLHKDFSKTIPKEVLDEREILIDYIKLSHSKFYGIKVGIMLDIDIAEPLVEFLCNIGIKPIYVFTSLPCENFEKRVNNIFKSNRIHGVVKENSDIYEFRKYILDSKVDLLFGETHLKDLSKELNIPLFKIGFPITDECSDLYMPFVGYRGAMRIIEKIMNLIE